MSTVYAFQKSLRCSAISKRTRKPCQGPAVTGWTVCRFHGARGGAPKGKRNGMYRHGLYTQAAGVSPTATDARIMEYTDNEYNYTFKFPSDWTEKEVVEQDELGEVRVLLQGPRASSIMVLVNPPGKGKKNLQRAFQ